MVDYASDEWSKPTNLDAGDLQIGAVEIKNSTDDTRAVVGSNGLYVDVRSALIAGTTRTLVTLPVAQYNSGTATLFVPTGTFKVINVELSCDAANEITLLSGATYLGGNASIAGFRIAAAGNYIETGTIDAPLYDGLADAASLVLKSSATGSLGGKITYYED